MDSIRLRAVHLLDDDWEPVADVAPDLHAKSAGPDDQIRDWIRATFIEIAPHAETVQVGGTSNAGSEYLKSEVGMNIILPAGYIDELRLKINLVQLGGAGETFAQDGFPNSSISSTSIVSGQVRLGISKALKFVPVVGGAIDDLLSVDINPWNFRIGTLRHVNVAFNGGLTAKPEWYFRRAGIRNDTVRVAMLLKKAPGTTNIAADVQAGWLYRPGTIGSRRVGSDTKTVVVFKTDAT
jgi:hypothetical protein